MTRIHELLLGRGCPASYPSLRRFILKRNWRKLSTATIRMEDTPPGEVAEADFGRLGLIPDPETGRRRAVWAMVIVLGHSRHCFVWSMQRQKLEDVIVGLEASWSFFGGIPRYLVIDNFPAHRGFIVDPARVRHPRDKPKVERGVPYVRERFFKGGDFDDLAHIRAAAPKWCLEVAGLRIHGTTRKKPLVVFQDEERDALPWAGEPHEIAHWRNAKVHQDHHVQCQQALYSVPSALCSPGQKVEVRVDSKLVHIYHRGQLIKTHIRQHRGGRSTDPEDYPAELTAYTTRAPDSIQRSAAQLGPAVAEFAERLFNGPQPWARIRQGHKLLRLGSATPPSASTPPAAGPWRWTSSTPAAWSASWCRPWKRRLCPRFRCPSQRDVSPVPAPYSPMLIPTLMEEVSHDPRHRPHTPAQAAPPEHHGPYPARAHRPGPKGAAGLQLLLGDHPLRRGDPAGEPAHRTAAPQRRLRGDLPPGGLRLVRRHHPGPPPSGCRLLPGVPGQARPRGVDGARRCRQELPGPRPWATPQSAPVKPSASSMPTASSGPWPRPGWTTRWTAPSEPS